MARKLQFKRGAKVALPVLAQGEPGFVTDEGRLYVGDGAQNIAMARADEVPKTAQDVGAANRVHGHVRADITDFPTAMPPTSHEHSATEISTGTLAVARGGTGQTSLQAARNAMGLGNTTGALPVANGGTGATTAETARVALGAAKLVGMVTVTLTVAGWAQNATDKCWYQAVSCAGILATDQKNVRIDPVGSTDAAAQKLTDEAFGKVDRWVCEVNGQLKARCAEEKPGVNFQAVAVIVR